MTQEPDRKPSKAEMRTGGRVATVVLVLLAVFTGIFIWMAG
jgi:multidrug resistance efflux pump